MNFTNLKGNIFGGITAGIVALPLALGFGVQSGLGASAGLYGAIMLGLVATIFGGTKTQISGPTGPMTIITATIVSVAISKYGNIENGLGIVVLTFVLAGIFQVVFGLLKIGKYVKFIPYPVLSGFMTGIGVIIIVFQLFPMMGLTSPQKIVAVFTEFPKAIGSANSTALALSGLTIAIIYLFPKFTKTVPSTLVALVLVTVISYLSGFSVPLIGDMPKGIPKLKIDSLLQIRFSDINLVLIPAITLAGIGAIDSLLTSVVADNLTKTRHRSNKELIGQGLGNISAALFGGLVGAGATMRTVVNIKSGGTGRLSGVIHVAILLLTLLGLGKYVSYIPLSTLAGVLITVGVGIIDKRGLRSILKVGKSDALILITVLILTVFVDLLQAVGIGMVIASLIFMRKASDMVEKSVVLEKVDEFDREIPWKDEQSLSENKWEDVYIHRFDGPLFFGVTTEMLDKVNKIPSNAKIIIFRMKKVPFIDQSGLYALADVVKQMHQMNITVLLTAPQSQPLMMLKQNKFIPSIISKNLVFETIDDCANWLKENKKS